MDFGKSLKQVYFSSKVAFSVIMGGAKGARLSARVKTKQNKIYEDLKKAGKTNFPTRNPYISSVVL